MNGSTNASVLLVGNFLSANVGNFSVCEDLAKKLRDEGMSVATASDHKARLPRFLDIVSTAWRRRHHYDVASVDVYSGLGFCLAEAACCTLRAAKKPYVLTLRGGNLPIFAKKWPRRVERLFRNAAVVATPSSYLQEHLRDIRSDIQLLPNPLHLERYNYRRREQLEPNLVWVRSFHSIYNPAMAPRVIAKLAREYPNIKLTMVGPDKKDGSLQETQKVAKELGVSDRIQFVGGVPKESVPQHLDSADILINTTSADNTPTSVLEAMACGLCVVSTNVGGIPHLLTHNVNGLMVEPNDVQAMCDAVSDVLGNQQLASKLSENARQYATQFDWQTLLPRWIELLAEVKAAN